MNIGVVEGFFGPQWPQSKRESYAEFLAGCGGEFYIYAPKQDPNLRKKWREPWTDEYKAMLSKLVHTFHQHGIKFGVGFSPFGLGDKLSADDKKYLEEKLQIMNDLGIDMLGLFFDDMPVSENLAGTQIEATKLVQSVFKKKIIFCPSYYTPDPILDKVFGQRPPGYLNEIADGIPSDISLAWTGPKVISPEIPYEHLVEVSEMLKRKPFIWENLFANDGPRNCKFLKMRPFDGRDARTFSESEAFGFNMMNQAELSKILFLASKYVSDGLTPDAGFEKALSTLCSGEFKNFIVKNRELLLTKGLDNIELEIKSALISELQKMNDPGASEIIDWLNGDYNVGSECLTD